MFFFSGVKLTDDLAELHLKKKRELEQRKDIFKSIGPNRKALCARYDLCMRRQFNYMNAVSHTSYNVDIIFNCAMMS